jgi:hypothetical protein
MTLLLSLSPHCRQHPSYSLLWQHRKVAILFILIAIGLLPIAQIFIPQKHVSTVVFTQDKCMIYAVGTLHAREILSNKKQFPSGLDCSTPTKIYLFNRQLNQQQGLGIYMDTFILKCDLKPQQCHSYYYKEIKNA